MKQYQVKRRQHAVEGNTGDYLKSQVTSTSTSIVFETASNPAVSNPTQSPIGTLSSRVKRLKITTGGKHLSTKGKLIRHSFQPSMEHTVKQMILPEKKYVTKLRVKTSSNILTWNQKKKMQIVPTRLVFMPTEEESKQEKIRMIDKAKLDKFIKVITDIREPRNLTVLTYDGNSLHVPVHLLKIFTIPEAKSILSLIPWEGTENRKARHIFATAIVDLMDKEEKAEERQGKERDGGG